MVFTDFLAALIVTLLISLVFGAFTREGPWRVWPWFFVSLLLFTWTVGVLSTPFGPANFGVVWAPFLFAGITFALIVAAAVPAREFGAKAANAIRQRNSFAGWMFWSLLTVLVVGLYVHYHYRPVLILQQ